MGRKILAGTCLLQAPSQVEITTHFVVFFFHYLFLTVWRTLVEHNCRPEFATGCSLSLGKKEMHKRGLLNEDLLSWIGPGSVLAWIGSGYGCRKDQGGGQLKKRTLRHCLDRMLWNEPTISSLFWKMRLGQLECRVMLVLELDTASLGYSGLAIKTSA